MKNTFQTILFTLLIMATGSCQGTVEKPTTETESSKSESKNLLPIQKSEFKTAVVKVPKQEELVKELKVKTIKNNEYDISMTETYNEKGMLIKTVEDDVINETTYKFDPEGRMINETSISNGELYGTSRYAYIGDKVKKVGWYRPNGERHGGVEYVYEEESNSVLAKTSNGYYREFYDNRGLLVRQEDYEEDNVSVDFYREYKYNEQGWQIRMTFCRIGNEENEYDDIYTHNEKGQRITEYDGYNKDNIVYSYNGKGLLIKEVITSEYGYSRTVDYVYTYY